MIKYEYFSYFSTKTYVVVLRKTCCGATKKYLAATLLMSTYGNNPKYWDRQAFANSADPDQTPQITASNQGLHCLPYIQQYFKDIKSSRMDYFKFQEKYGKWIILRVYTIKHIFIEK